MYKGSAQLPPNSSSVEDKKEHLNVHWDELVYYLTQSTKHLCHSAVASIAK